MGKLLAVSGKKQSGKGTTTSYIQRCCEPRGIPIKVFSFADKLKKFCIEVLGLRHEQCYGTDAEKDTIVPHLLWENFPIEESRRVRNKHGYVVDMKTGPMTGREVMQFFGTDIIRKWYGKTWINAARREIRTWMDENPNGVALNEDCRFPDEVDGIHAEGGLVLRLTRKVADDEHSSETALDPDVYDWSKFDHVLDNQNMSADEQLAALRPWLRKHDIVPPNLLFHKTFHSTPWKSTQGDDDVAK